MIGGKGRIKDYLKQSKQKLNLSCAPESLNKVSFSVIHQN